ncbi:hypothetical protein M422DRAFT_245906 [Sphaerobolus stellatus SS14]|nr:hypothetical protein M422DRAFT_245906 [Sphaerobolus stellatus SS14]
MSDESDEPIPSTSAAKCSSWSRVQQSHGCDGAADTNDQKIPSTLRSSHVESSRGRLRSQGVQSTAVTENTEEEESLSSFSVMPAEKRIQAGAQVAGFEDDDINNEEEEEEEEEEPLTSAHHLDKGKGAMGNDPNNSDTEQFSVIYPASNMVNDDLDSGHKFHFERMNRAMFEDPENESLCYAALTETIAYMKRTSDFTAFYGGPQPRIASIADDKTSETPDFKVFCLDEGGPGGKLQETILLGVEQKPPKTILIKDMKVEDARKNVALQLHILTETAQARNQAKYVAQANPGVTEGGPISWLTFVGPYWVLQRFGPFNDEDFLVRDSKIKAKLSEEGKNSEGSMQKSWNVAFGATEAARSAINWNDLQRSGDK